MTTETILKAGFNKVTIEGLVKEKRFDIKKEGTSDEILIGEIDIETDENSTHTLKLITKKFKKDGNPNKIFESLMTVNKEYKSIQEVGKDNADKVKITNGELGRNEYWGQDGQLKSYPQLRTNFINRLKPSEEYQPVAKFEVEVFVDRIVNEIKNEEETGRVIIHSYIVGYGGSVVPFQFVVEGEQKVNYVIDNYQKGMTVKLFGIIVNHSETKEITKEVAFGEPQVEIITTTIREYQITGGTEFYDEEKSGYIDPKLITKALQERENRLEELKNKQQSSSNSNSGSNSGAQMAFGGEVGGKTSNKVEEDITDEDLPF